MKGKMLGNTYFKGMNGFIMFFITAVSIFPFLYILSLSLSESGAVLARKVSVFPVGLNLKAYGMVLDHPGFLQNYKNTIVYTAAGTLLALIMTVICAYPLSKRHLKGRGFLMKLIIFTMFFGGGIIPNFVIVRNLGLIDKIWAVILPGAISQWNLILMITFFQGLPPSLEESASIDGLNPFQCLARIVLPLSKPIIATIALYYAVGIWNDWFSSLIYLNTPSKYPVMLLLRNIVMGTEAISQTGAVKDARSANVVGITVRSASIILTMIPILCVYPFVQKYFVKGVLVGSLKG